MADGTSEQSIFWHAIGLSSPAERAAYLGRACGDDARLRAEIDALLAAHDRLGSSSPARGEATAETEPPAPGEEPGARIGPYRLLEQIGEGGMGAVFLAEQTAPVRRMVALKVIKAGMDSRQVLARFEAERQALALMDHPNIAKVLDAGSTDGGRPYFVMELVKGVPITRYCDERRLSPRERLELFVPVCQAVQHAHQKGIIHRDLKPSNVLVGLYDGKPVPKVIDFGIAKATGPNLTEATLFTGFGAVVGTPEYMSPEQATLDNLDIDTRSDVYALGVLLYELLTGTTPLDRRRLKEAAILEVLRVIREEEPPGPSTRLSTSDDLPSIAANRGVEPRRLSGLVRGELDWIVMKALEKERSRRYETANALARDVEHYLADEVIEARPASAGYRLRKFARRHRGQVIAAALVLLALVVGMIGTTWGYLGAERARLAAEAANERAQKRLEQLQRGNELLGGIFDDLDINAVKAGDRPLEAVLADRLVKAAEQLEGESVGDPLAVASLQERLAVSLLSLGFAPQAIPVLAKVRATRESRIGPDHPDSLDALHNLALGYAQAGKLDLAVPLFEEALRLRRARLGPDHRDSLSSLSALAVSYGQDGQLGRALPLLEEALRLRRARLGPDHQETLDCMNNLAVGYQQDGQLDKALPMLEEAVRLHQAKLGPDHPQSLITMKNLGMAYQDAGKRDEALSRFKEVLRLSKARLGAEHPETLVAMACLASGYRDAGDLDKASSLLEEVLRLTKAKQGADHPDTLIAMNNVATCYRDAGRLEEALPMLEEALRLTKAKQGADHPDTLSSMSNLASTYRDAGRLEGALPMLEEALRLAKAKLGVDHPQTLGIMNNLATGYWSAHRPDQSIPLFEQTLRLREKKLGRNHPDTLQTVGNLGVNYKDAGRLDEALPLLEEAYRASRAIPALRRFAAALLDGFARAGRSSAAAALVKERLAAARTSLAAGSPQLARMLAEAGSDLLRLKAYDEAESLLRECLAILEKAEPDAWSTSNTRSLLGGALLGLRKYAEAEPLLLRGYEGLKGREASIPRPAADRLPEAVDRLIELYATTSRPGEADRWRAERAKYPPGGETGAARPKGRGT